MVQTDFAVLPPPIAWPTFPQGMSYFKARGTSFSLRRDGLAFDGGGFDAVVRNSFTEVLASSVQIALAGMKGTTDLITNVQGALTPVHSDITLGEALLGMNAEAQLYRGERTNMVLFAGPLFTILTGSVDSTFVPNGPFGILADSGSSYGYLYGVQGGGLAGAAVGAFHLDAVAMLHHHQGKSHVSWSLLGDASAGVPSSTTVSCGADLVYLPRNITVSFVLQKRNDAWPSRGYRARLYQISWTF